MANALYNLYKNAAMTTGAPNLVSDTIKAMLVTSTYVPNLNTDQYASTPAANRVPGTTDQTLATKSVTLGVFDVTVDPTWLAVTAGATAKFVVLYKDTGTPSTSPLIACLDTISNFPVTTNGGDITVQWDNGANKIFAL